MLRYRQVILALGILATFSPYFLYMANPLREILGSLSPFGLFWAFFMASPYLLFYIGTRYIRQSAIVIALGLILLGFDLVVRIVVHLHPDYEQWKLLFLQSILLTLLLLSTGICYLSVLCFYIFRKSTHVA